MKHHHCNAISCMAATAGIGLFCEAHEKLLTPLTLRALVRTYKPKRRPSKRFTFALEQARDELLYAKKTGHRLEHDAPLDWADGLSHPEK